jgi:fibronectin type 3 domain-containing protein
VIRSRILVLEVIFGLLVSTSLLTAQIPLSWSASLSSDVTSYNVRYGTSSGSYSAVTNVGNQTSARVTGLQAGQTYYLAVTAQTAAGSESLPSNEISYQVPVAPAPVVTLTTPTSGASYSSPATVNLAASVTANGYTITKVQFFNGTTLLGEDTAAPYSYAWNNVGAGNYSLTARAVYGVGNTVVSAPVNIVVTALPAPWQTVDIGTTGLAGSVGQTNGLYTVRGAGQLSGTKDSFRFVYQTLSADGEIKMQLTTVQTDNPNSRFGVMIRESLAANSKYAFMGMTPALNFRWQRRSSSGGSTAATTSTTTTPPYSWVRLVRTGNTLVGYKSGDGTKWTKVASRSITMAANVYVGYVVASGDTNVLSTATYANGFVVP